MEQVFYIDLKNITSKEALHELLAKELSLPEHYGRNLDALHDVLTEPGDNWNLIFYNCDGTRQAVAARSQSLENSVESQISAISPGPQPQGLTDEFITYMAKFRKMCAAACKECDGLRIRFF